MPEFVPYDSELSSLNFDELKILVVGDIMLDRYTFGRATRISPEAPVPVLDFEKEENRLGGAANVALNLQSLGATPILMGVVGVDEDGEMLLQALASASIGHEMVLRSKERITTVKTRFMAGRQQLIRLDKEITHDLSESDTKSILENAIDTLQNGNINGLLFQDYNKGVLTQKVIEVLTKEAQKLSIPIFVDPKHLNFWSFHGATLFKPNLKEVREAIGTTIEPTLPSLGAAANEIRSRNGAKNILITLSEKGLFLDNGYFSAIVSTKPRIVADPCGAGDTVISIAALALCNGLSAQQVAILANLAGGLVVEQSGVVCVDKQRLLEEFLVVRQLS